MKKTSLKKLLILISASVLSFGDTHAAPQQAVPPAECCRNGSELISDPIVMAAPIDAEVSAPIAAEVVESEVLNCGVVVEASTCCGAGETVVMSADGVSTAGLSMDLNVLLTGQVNELKETVAGLQTENESLAAAGVEMEAQLAELKKQADAATAALAELEQAKQELVALREAKKEWEESQKSMSESIAAKDQQISKLQAEIASLGEADTLASASDKTSDDEDAEDAEETESNDAPPAPEEPAPQQPATRDEGDQPAEDQPAEDQPAENDSPEAEKSDSGESSDQPAEESPAEESPAEQ